MKLLKSVYKENPIDESTSFFELNKTWKNKTVVELLYNEPRGEGDAHYVDVKFEDGSEIRIFRPDEIEFLVVG